MHGMSRGAVVFLFLSFAQAKLSYKGHKLITAQAKSQRDVEFLHSLEERYGLHGIDFWREPSLIRPTDIRVSPNEFVKVRDLLKDAGIQFQVTNDDIQNDIDVEEESRRSTRALNTGLCNVTAEYCSFQQIEELLAYWQQSDNNVILEIDTLGQTYLGENIYMVQISKSYRELKPAIIVEAGTHAREWISVSSALVLIQELLSGSARAQILLAKYDWYIVPVHNPDGYKYTFTNERLWRKNRAPCNLWGSLGWDSGKGIDLNRNWDAGFGGPGSSEKCDSPNYRGTRAFEAEETAALAEAFQKIKSVTTVKAFFSLHCYSELMLVPFAYTSSKPAAYDQLVYVAGQMMDALYEVDGRTFAVGTPPDILYIASGGSYDYFYLQGAEYSYTYELRPASSSQGGFLLPTDQIYKDIASGGSYDYFYLQGAEYSYTYELRPASSSQGGFLLPTDQIYKGTEEFIASVVRFVTLDI